MSRKNVPLLIAAGLAILFERFSYYSVRTVLMLMMLKQMHLPQAEASVIYADFTTQVYLTVIAGALAVLVLGARVTTLLGGVIMVIGAGLLVPADPSLLTTALFLVALGSGLFRMGIYASAGGALMETSGVTAAGVMLLFYAALNTGAFFAPLVTGTIAQVLGSFRTAMMIASAGALVALVVVAGGALASGKVREPFRFDRARGLLGALLYLPALFAVYVLMELVGSHVEALAAGTPLQMLWVYVNPLVVMGTGLVAGILFLAIGRVRRGLRLEWIFAAGMLMFAASALLVLAPGAGLPPTQRIIAAVVLGAAGEVILTGAAYARLAAGTAPRLAALVLAPCILITLASNSVSRSLRELPDASAWTWGFAAVVALLGIAAVALSGVFERRVYAAPNPAPAASEATAA